MKRTIVSSLVLSLATLLGSAQMHAADSKIVGSLRTQYEITSTLVMGMANAIPEDKYDFKPTPEVRSFREQLTHLVAESTNYVALVSGEGFTDPATLDKMKTKAEIVKALKGAYEHGTKVLADLTDDQAVEVVSIAPNAPLGLRGQQKQKWAIIMAVLLDNMDHYGNLVVYGRLNGLVPPRTAARMQPQK